jgi:hypothetical protein
VSDTDSGNEPDPQDPDESQEAEWPPGEVPALEPGDLPNRPLRAADVTALLAKEIA